MGGMKNGTVSKWNDEKGFGFITPDDGGDEDLFCHKTAVSDNASLSKGDKVEYEESYDDRKGKMKANNVKVLGGGGGGGGRDYDRGGSRGGYDRDRGSDRGRGDDDRRGGGGYDRSRYDDRSGGGDRYDDRRDNRGKGGGKGEKYGGRKGEDISEGGNRHVTARELYMQGSQSRRRSPSSSRSRSRSRRR